MNCFARSLVVFTSFLVGPSVVIRAQTASEHFPNDDPNGTANVQVAGTMQLGLKVQGLGAPIRASVPVIVGESGQQVAVDSARALCVEASTGVLAMVCDDPTCTFPIGGTKTITCASGPTGFSITRINTQVSFTVSPTGSTRLQSLSCRTPSGNTHGDDLLERVLVRVDPNGVQGNVVFRVHHFQGGQNPRTFTVNTTGLSDVALHTAIRDGYNGMGLGLTAVLGPPPGCFFSADPDDFPGNLTEVTYSAATQSTLLDFEMDGLRLGSLQGQILTMATLATPATGCVAPLPAASSCPINNASFLGNKQTLAWTFPAGCPLPPSFDVVKADLACRCNTCATCLENDDGADMQASDAVLPLPGQGFWYLVRVNGGTWNDSGTGLCTNHDAANPLGCP